MSVPLFSPDLTQLTNAKRALMAAGVSFAIQESWRAFMEAARRADVSVFVIRWLVDLDAYPFNGGSHNWDPAGMIVITDPHPDNLRRLVTLTAAEVLFLGQETKQLVPTLEALLHQKPFPRWATAFRREPGLPRLLRRALVTVLEQEPPPTPVEPGQPAAIPRSVRCLATRLGCSEDHLRRSACQVRIALPALLKWNVALRALQMHLQPGTTWEAVAWRLGFAGASGLSEHFKHTLGLRPTAASAIDIDRWVHQFEKQFLDAVHIGDSEKASDSVNVSTKGRT